MTLAPIRGAPPFASVPGFPTQEPAQQSATPASGDQRPTMLWRQRYTPVDIGGNGITLTFRVIPKMPAISPASLTVHVIDRGFGLKTVADELCAATLSNVHARNVGPHGLDKFVKPHVAKIQERVPLSKKSICPCDELALDHSMHRKRGCLNTGTCVRTDIYGIDTAKNT